MRLGDEIRRRRCRNCGMFGDAPTVDRETRSLLTAGMCSMPCAVKIMIADVKYELWKDNLVGRL